MKKEELVNIISQRLSSQGRETTVAFDVFLQKVAESLEVNESVKIPDVGIFQLKRKGNLSAADSAARGKSSFYLLFVPLKFNRKDKNEVLAFQVNPRNVKRAEIDDEVFSLSVDQPVIPVTEQARKDFLVHSSYLMLQKNFEDRVESILSNSVNLSDFEIEYNFSSMPEENRGEYPSGMEKETLKEESESIPWDFGEDEAVEESVPEENTPGTVAEGFSDEIPGFDAASNDLQSDLLPVDAEIREVNAPEESVAEGGSETDEESETEEVLNEIMPEDGLKVPDDLFKDLLGEAELTDAELDEAAPQEEEVPRVEEKLPGKQGNSELGEDWFTLQEIDEEIPEKIEKEEEPAEDLPAPLIDDQVENIDDKLELLSEMEAGVEIDPFEDFALEEESAEPEEVHETDLSQEEEIPLEEIPMEENPVEEKPLEEEEIPQQEDIRLEDSEMDGITLENKNMPGDEEEPERRVKYPGTFWIILSALVLVTLGGVYYFFFMGKNTISLPDFAKKGAQSGQAVADGKPQVIERDYSVPVTVYKKSNEESNHDLKEGENEAPNTEVNNTAEGKTTQENKNTGLKTETPQTVQGKKTENKQQETKAPVTKLPGKGRQANMAGSNPVAKQNESQGEVSIQPRGDSKNKLIKEFIFTDGKGRYTIQESSWQSVSEAIKRVQHFRSQGLDAYYMKYAPRGGKVWYRVRIGDYSALEDAEKTLKRLK
ncbi:MAG: hypothetical protein HF314_12850 [Ignavibacteria bacterium]|jgi:septal ring-binding cell division protein DamX|nr:hypothetical protein [Ignavibacteria bacterium]MCU7503963.1 hypothetical protein [Ignavibacteria bacterium]MCU7515816.1 hypothetical protein [Ignavibacteria bacterium]